MPDVTRSLVSAKRSCPLCESRSRRQIDICISEWRPRTNDSIQLENGEMLDGETGQIIEHLSPPSYTKLEAALRELLEKVSDDTTTFDLNDLIIHVTEHSLVTEITGVSVRREGNLLFVGDQVYQSVDLKDNLAVGIQVGLQQLLSGKMKITSAAWINMNALLWRMSGNLGADEFVQAMIDKVSKGDIDTTSPLGASYADRQKKMERAKIKEEQEEREEMDSELEIGET